MTQIKKKLLSMTLLFCLMVASFTLTARPTTHGKAAVTHITETRANGLHPSISLQETSIHLLHMKTLKENNDTIKRRRKSAPRNSMSVKQRSSNSNKDHQCKWKLLYRLKEWKTLRDNYIAVHPLCEECMMFNKTTPATEVHHIIPFSHGKSEESMMRLLLSWDNLKAVCHSCHKKLHIEDKCIECV